VILSTAKVEDVDRFLETFTTKGAEKRKEHGSRGAYVFRDPNDDTRVWVMFDWDDEGYAKLLADPDMPAIFQEAGLQAPPQPAELVREVEA
jgi:quinol monooxygenase YgiN